MGEQTIELDMQLRETTGKAVKHLRRQGQVPAVIHDHGKASVLVQAPYTVLHHAYQQAGRNRLISLKAGAKSYTALIKDATFEPRKNQLTHVVFNAVKRNQKVEAEVPVRPRYAAGNDSSPAERAGLIVLTQTNTVLVRAVPDKLPEALEYDAEQLAAEGDQVMVSALIVPDGVEIVEEEAPVATVTSSAALDAANAATAGTAEAEQATAEPSAAGDENTEAPAAGA